MGLIGLAMVVWQQIGKREHYRFRDDVWFRVACVFILIGFCTVTINVDKTQNEKRTGYDVIDKIKELR